MPAHWQSLFFDRRSRCTFGRSRMESAIKVIWLVDYCTTSQCTQKLRGLRNYSAREHSRHSQSLAELEPRSGQFPLGRPSETTVNALSVFCFAGHPRTGLVASQKGVKEVCTVIVDHNLVKLERTAPASP